MPKLQSSKTQVAVAAASFVGMTVSVYPILFSTFPLLLQPVSNEFGWGRGVMPMAMLVAAPVMTVLYPLVGRLLDRFGSRRVLLTGFLLFGIAVCGLSQLNGSVPQLIALYLCACVFSTLPTGVSFARTIAQYFQHSRGLILGLCLGVGGGVGSAITPQLTNFLLEHFGWRGAYIGIGLAPILIGFPTVFFFLGNRRSVSISQAPSEHVFGLTAKEAVRKPEMILLAACTFLSCIVISGVAAHLGAIVTDHGFSSSLAATILSVLAISTMAGQFGAGFFLDRIHSPRVALPMFGALFLGIPLLYYASNLPMLMGAAILIGFGTGSEYGLLPYFLTRFFGLKSFGLLYGSIYASAAIATGIGPFIMGRVFDMTGSYGTALTAFEIAMLCTLVLVGFLRPYVYAPNGTPLRGPVAEAEVGAA